MAAPPGAGSEEIRCTEGGQEEIDSTELPDEDMAAAYQIEAVQTSILKGLRDSKDALASFDRASSSELDAAVAELDMHCQLLKMVKADLDTIHKSLRAMKAKVKAKLEEPRMQ